jgi:hypothetical protein
VRRAARPVLREAVFEIFGAGEAAGLDGAGSALPLPLPLPLPSPDAGQ